MRWYKRIALVAVVIAAGAPAAAEAAPPANDTFGGAMVIVANPFGDTVDTTEATTDADDESAAAACGMSPEQFSNSVWYALTPATDRTVNIDATGSSYSVAGAVVTGSPGAFTAVPGGCFLGRTRVELSAGTTYYIPLAQYGAGAGGNLRVIVADYVAPDVTLTVDPSGSFTKAGSAVVSGTASCTPGFGSIGVGVTQAVGRVSTIQGNGFGSLTCDGTVQPWSVIVTPYTGLFRGGKATVTGSANVCDGFACDYAETTRSVALKGR